MRLYQILEESHRADLYHGTSLSNAEKIVATNTFLAKTPVHDASVAGKHNNKKTVSLTRDIKTAINLSGDSYNDIRVVFVLDGSKLQQNLGKSVRPYDDTGTQWYADQQARYSRDGIAPPVASSRPTRSGNEKEEAVFGNIKNANAYIKKIIIVFDPDGGGDYKDALTKKVNSSPLFKDPRVEFANADAEFARTPRQTQANLKKEITPSKPMW